MKRPRIEVFRARNQQLGFRVVAANGRRVLTAGETFTGSPSHVRRAIRSTIAALQGAMRARRVSVVTRGR
jgi:hypothetical protein